MELLSEVRTPQQALNYAVNRETGQANQPGNPEGKYELEHSLVYSSKQTTNANDKHTTVFHVMLETWKPILKGSRGPQDNSSPNCKQQQTRRVKHIKQEMPESDQTEESVDVEAGLYIKELHETGPT